MLTGDFRGAGPFAAEWILESGRQEPPDDRPEVRWVEHADAPDACGLSEVDAGGAWIRIDDPVDAPDMVL